MASRILVILICVPTIFVVLNAGNLARFFLFSLISVRGQFEFFQMMKKEDQPSHPFLEYFSGVGILALALLLGERGVIMGISIALTFLVFGTVLRGLSKSGFHRFSLGLTSLFYLPFCLSFYLIIGKSFGGACLFGLLVAIWSLDIGAYIVGSSLRGPKLAPNISPNKTISGAIGGSLACTTTIWALSANQVLPFSVQKLVVFAICLSFVGQVADLFESALKREVGVKDTGSLFGNHGGMLDRLDSVVLLGPVSFFFLNF